MRPSLISLAGPGVVLAVALGGCATPGDDLLSIEQPSFIEDLGSRLGTPVVIGDTTFSSNNYQLPCGGLLPAPDDEFTWTAPATGTYVISTAGSLIDTVLGLLDSAGRVLDCNDQAYGTNQSRIIRNMVAGQRFIIVVDGSTGTLGEYQLNITPATTPPTSDGQQLWLRADLGVNAPGNRIASWQDHSGQGNSAVMATAARQPFFVPNAIHGLPVARFQGAQSMYLSQFLSPVDFTIFVVGKNSNPDESFSMILGPGGSSPNNQLRWENGSHVSIVGTSNNLQEITSAIGNTRVYHTLEVSSDSITVLVYRDNDRDDLQDVETSGPFTLASVGSWYSSFFLQGDLAEVLVYDHRLSDVDRFGVREYLSVKYGLP
jgi:hypothetical protein